MWMRNVTHVIISMSYAKMNTKKRYTTISRKRIKCNSKVHCVLSSRRHTSSLPSSSIYLSTSFSLSKQIKRLYMYDDEILDKKIYIHLICKLEFNIPSLPFDVYIHLRYITHTHIYIMCAHSSTFGAMAFCFMVQFKISYQNQTKPNQIHSLSCSTVHLFVVLFSILALKSETI